VRGGGRLPAFGIRRLRQQWEAANGSEFAAAAAAEAVTPPLGFLTSLTCWLWPDDAPRKEPAHLVTGAPSAPRLGRADTGAASTGQLWGADIDYAADGDAAAGDAGGPLVESYDASGARVMMRRTLSGRLLPAEHGGGADPAPYSDGRMHRSLSSRVAGAPARPADSTGSLLSTDELAASCAAPSSGSPLGAWVAHYLGLGWLSAWVDSRQLFAAPEEAPNRMRRSMSSRVMTAKQLSALGEGGKSRVWEMSPAPSADAAA
jgi:hypothetical protein